MGLSLASEVNLQMVESSAVDHILNCCFHCSTETPLLQSTMAFFRTVQQAVTPTKLFPAPQGKTMTPDLARPLPNIFRRDFSWYGLRTAFGFRSMLMSAFRVS